jgi:choice-of-anchor A domain-containing protein
LKKVFVPLCILFCVTSKLTAQINLLSDCVAGAVPGCPVPFPFPPQTWPGINGRDNAFNLFVGGNLIIENGGVELEGKTFVMGNFNVQKTTGSYSVGFSGAGSWVVPDNGTDVMILGGNALTAGANVFFGGFYGLPGSQTDVVGNFRYKGTVTGSKFFAGDIPGGLDGQIISDPGLDLLPYQNAVNNMTVSSTYYKGLPGSANIVHSYDGFGNYTFGSTDGAAGLYVFNITTDLNPGTPAAIIFDNFPDGAQIVINMLKPGTVDINMNSISFTNITGNTDKLMEHLIWNFPNATTVNLKGTGEFRGAVLSTAVDNYIDVSTNGRFVATGNVIQGSNSAGIEIHNYPFRGNAPVVLPIKLQSFFANISGTKAILTWKTQGEYDINYYEIEAGNDGRNFKSAGIVNTNTASGGIYNFNYALGNEKNYYFRLKFTDKNNSYTYSNVILLKAVRDNEFSASILQNPAKEKLTVYLPYAEKAAVIIYDSFGRIVKQGISIANNVNHISINSLSAGIYFIKLTNKNGQIVIKKVVVE